ncbi:MULTISPECIES: hypothetical protein [unclassified Mucilaginibacter]|uniref:hypothetical protein n=1 Tax=unclassified Mucilaginibacter TaxID=2617802 RepID=UPI002AC9D294|nr:MULTISPECIES: hypothetical protein [unclassified Mucilaginibacter]MEB0263185.1 hypothetical protein [Mucilaginibacter sp. 10I4]MEB0280103.1 hypothetical protein [Mucilaginibacter sp. 10B2]MEB0301061.1 hypothetical protein [Mucilaginibacter sp. 5C4]WPX24488.1 hypothetical protein RHM67_04260 [Mucilaginibacter sp. 5C4]
MKTQLSVKSAALALLLVLAFVISWELYLRHQGVVTDYDDGPELWAHTREQVYEPSDKSIVFIGSSRIKYDLDIATWQGLTNKHAIQLAMVASSPRHILTNLANDPKFKGKLIIDVTEVLFFSNRGNASPDAGIAYYKERTPAQKLSFLIDKPIESRLAFLNNGKYAINAFIGEMHIPNRPMVYPFLDFPQGFGITLLNRQTKMSADFVTDTNKRNKVKAIWGLLKNDPTPPMSGKALDLVMQSVTRDVAKIKARGGDVVFTRTPSSGFFLMAENHMFPREAYWNRLLKETGCKGIYYADYPVMASLTCPEFSHLSPAGAVTYTHTLVNILKHDKIWGL